MGTPERHAAFSRDAATVDRRRVKTEGVSVIVGHITNVQRPAHQEPGRVVLAAERFCQGR